MDFNSLQRQLQQLSQQISTAYPNPNQFSLQNTPVPPMNPNQISPPIQSRQVQYVDGIQGAKIYQDGLPSNSSEIIMDKNEDKFYLVSKDANGTISHTIPVGRFTLEESKTEEPVYLTRKDLENFKEEIKDLIKLNTTSQQKVATVKKA